jgi:hypothetical protein
LENTTEDFSERKESCSNSSAALLLAYSLPFPSTSSGRRIKEEKLNDRFPAGRGRRLHDLVGGSEQENVVSRDGYPESNIFSVHVGKTPGLLLFLLWMEDPPSFKNANPDNWIYPSQKQGKSYSVNTEQFRPFIDVIIGILVYTLLFGIPAIIVLSLLVGSVTAAFTEKGSQGRKNAKTVLMFTIGALGIILSSMVGFFAASNFDKKRK